jgi:DNA gyrase subunit A
MVQICGLETFVGSDRHANADDKDETMDLSARFTIPQTVMITRPGLQSGRLFSDERCDYHYLASGIWSNAPAHESRLQGAAGGAKWDNTREEDFIEHIYVANMNSNMLFFKRIGQCYG